MHKNTKMQIKAFRYSILLNFISIICKSIDFLKGHVSSPKKNEADDAYSTITSFSCRRSNRGNGCLINVRKLLKTHVKRVFNYLLVPFPDGLPYRYNAMPPAWLKVVTLNSPVLIRNINEVSGQAFDVSIKHQSDNFQIFIDHRAAGISSDNIIGCDKIHWNWKHFNRSVEPSGR